MTRGSAESDRLSSLISTVIGEGGLRPLIGVKPTMGGGGPVGT